MSEGVIHCNKWSLRVTGLTPEKKLDIAQLFYAETLDAKYDNRTNAVKKLFDILTEKELGEIGKEFSCKEHPVDAIIAGPWTILFNVNIKSEKKDKIIKAVQSPEVPEMQEILQQSVMQQPGIQAIPQQPAMQQPGIQTQEDVERILEDLNELDEMRVIYKTERASGRDWHDTTPITHGSQTLLIKQKLTPLQTNMLSKYINDNCTATEEGQQGAQIQELLDFVNKWLNNQVAPNEWEAFRISSEENATKAKHIEFFCNGWKSQFPQAHPTSLAIDFFFAKE